ncbi:ATP-binding protein [Sphingobacterium sp. MYb388]|uniref:ATP-binding protein n=1 Tax=Sphingobacterium sp. MYb388 TaxID=2745437 RepID=UPI0030B053FF
MSLQKTPGEVSALAGFFFQYEIFATEIYNHLLESNLEWVEFASNTAGKLDDVLLGVEDKVIAFQVKQISNSNFSYHDFVNSETQSIFQGLFKGWKSFKSKYHNKKIDARFITTQDISANDQIKAYVGKKKPSFENFIVNFWTPIQKGIYNSISIPKVWQVVFDELVSQINATPDELISFIVDLKFVFNYKTNQFVYDSYTQSKRSAHINRITDGIARIVAKKGNVHYDRKQFLAEFSLKDQFETRFQHAFFVDEKHYQPINTTLMQLASVIERKGKGYIALVGNAGSGKSTLLTKWLTGSAHRVLKYYAYTNVEMSYEYGYRGEASYFLHDLLVQIRESRSVLQDRLPENDLLDLQVHLGEELAKLGRNNEKVFIIVDGLDHINREQQVTKSLIEVLPSPKVIPENIYFVLGSRTVTQLEDLSFEIRQDLTKNDSIVTINALAKEQINELALSHSISLSGHQLDDLQQNTKGHPLFLRYTIEELRAADLKNYSAIISEKDFSGDIEIEYQKFWDKHKSLDEFIHILGLIARFRYPYFELELLGDFSIKNADAERINKVSEYYFYKSENIWQFFHNSFKEFLIRESAKNRFSAKFDPVTHSAFHSEIADAIVNNVSSYRFNLIYHWFNAGKFQQITDSTSQAFFREQWFAFRNVQIIREDIKLALHAGVQQGNNQMVIICFFALLEIDQRASNFPFGNYYDIFLAAERLDLASSFVFDPAKLLVSQTAALEFSVLLANNGYKEIAKELFERATPIHLFVGQQSLSRRRYNSQNHTEIDEVELIKVWANAASIFQPICEFIIRLQNLQISEEHGSGPDKQVIPEVILSLKEYLLENDKYETLIELDIFAEENLDKYDKFYFYSDIIHKRFIPQGLKRRALEFFNKCSPKGHNSYLLSYASIFTLVLNDLDRGKIAFEKLETPAEIKKRIPHFQIGSMANYVFNYTRLYYTITKNFSLPIINFLPISDKPTEKTFLLAFARMGQAHAWYHHGYPEASAEFFGGLEKLFGMFHHSYDSPLYDYDIIANKGLFLKQVLSSSLSISPQTTIELLEKLTSEWKSNKRFWSDETIQNIVRWVIERKVDADWCKRTLVWLEETIYSTGYLQKIIDDSARQTRLWAKLGMIEKVEAGISKLMAHSLGMGPEEDRQVEQMVRWMEKHPPVDETGVQFYFDRLISIRNKVNSSSHTPARDILKMALPFGNGYRVFEHLLFHQLVPLLDGLEIILVYLLQRNSGWSNLLMKLFTQMVITMDSAHSTRRSLITTFFTQQPPQEEVQALVKGIKIFAVAEVRTKYLLAIKNLCVEHGIAPEAVDILHKPEFKNRERGSSENLHLNDNRILELETVLEQVKNIDDFIKLRGETAEHSYFNWTEILIKVIPGADEVSLFKIISDFNLDIDTKQIIRIVDALQSSGKTKLAQELLERTITSSRYCQWGDDYYEKGKIPAYQKLQELCSDTAVKSSALKDFTDALPNLSIGARESIISDLDQILFLFGEEVNMDMIYQEINLFRDQLFTNDMPLYELDIIGNDNDELLLTDLLFFLITTPSQFDYIIFPILITENKKLKSLIHTLLRRLFDEGFTIKFLHFLHGLGEKSRAFTDMFLDEIVSLVNNERADVVVLASDLLNLAQITPVRNIQAKDLPLNYTLELSPQSGLVDLSKKAFENISLDGYLKETTDPLIFTQIIKYEIKILAKLTGFHEYNIAYRIREIGNDTQFPKWCATIGEPELRNLYETVLDLQIPYSRPQVQKVFDGLGKVIMELCDLGHLNFKDVVGLLPHFDSVLYQIKTVEMPPFISSILKSSGSAPSADRKWAHEINEKYVSSVIPSFDGEYFILAERTLLQGMGHGKALEIRQAFVDTDQAVPQSIFSIFPSTTEELIRDYPEINQQGIVIYNNCFSTLPVANWLAINPLVAYDLGLTYNVEQGNFRWDNSSGDSVIESIFWKLGDTANKSGHHDSEAGFGWRVIISRKGLEDIIDKLEGQPLYHYKKVTRNLEFYQKRYNTYIKEDDSKSTVEAFEL